VTDQPIYNRLHGGHPETDPRYCTVGFDVVRTDWSGPTTVIEVVAVTEGATSYIDALGQAKQLRDPFAPVWAWPGARYACGCRWVATAIEDGRSVFRDLQAVAR
jgi:hypothetical protein